MCGEKYAQKDGLYFHLHGFLLFFSSIFEKRTVYIQKILSRRRLRSGPMEHKDTVNDEACSLFLHDNSETVQKGHIINIIKHSSQSAKSRRKHRWTEEKIDLISKLPQTLRPNALYGCKSL
jgi:hypothetical protein